MLALSESSVPLLLPRRHVADCCIFVLSFVMIAIKALQESLIDIIAVVSLNRAVYDKRFGQVLVIASGWANDPSVYFHITDVVIDNIVVV